LRSAGWRGGETTLRIRGGRAGSTLATLSKGPRPQRWLARRRRSLNWRATVNPRGWAALPFRTHTSSPARRGAGGNGRGHHAHRRRGGRVAARGAHAAMACRSTGNAMKGITEWLASIGLSEYAQRFADNGIDLSVIRDLTEQDLKDLGILLGHRRKILRAIAELEGVPPAPIETATEPVA